MLKVKIVSVFLVGSLAVAGVARSQQPEPRADPGNDAPQEEDTAQGDDSAAASVDYFHDQLAPYGQWATREGYGVVWTPQTTPGWRPYTTGHWANTDQGFAWVADESWGWAPFHYGRWYYDQELGWSWLPGSTWAPAWVAWQSGGGYLGWAPLPPAVAFGAAVGLMAEATLGITPGFYTFVREGDFLAPRVATVIVPSARNATIVKTTKNITRYTVVNNHIVNAGVSVNRIQLATGHPVPKIQIASLTSAGAAGKKGAFFQPPVVVKAAKVSHAEFGAALPKQVTVQQKSKSFAQVSGRSTQSRTTAGTTGSVAQRRTPTTTGKTYRPNASTGQSGTTGKTYGSSTSAGQTGQTSRTGQVGSQPGNSYAPKPRYQPTPAPSAHHAEPAAEHHAERAPAQSTYHPQPAPQPKAPPPPQPKAPPPPRPEPTPKHS